MSKLWSKLKEKKFLIILLVVLVSLASAVFLFREEASNEPTATSEEATPNNDKVSSRQLAEEVNNWPEYTNSEGKYHIKYKPGWSKKVCKGSEETLYLAPDEESQAVCGAEKGSQIYVASYRGDQRSDESAIVNYGDNVHIEHAEESNINGKKISFTSSRNEFVADGTVEISYEYFTNSRTYIIHYSQGPDQPDLKNVFEQTAQSIIFIN